LNGLWAKWQYSEWTAKIERTKPIEMRKWSLFKLKSTLRLRRIRDLFRHLTSVRNSQSKPTEAQAQSHLRRRLGRLKFLGCNPAAQSAGPRSFIPHAVAIPTAPGFPVASDQAKMARAL
jgi:hypothetical protein